MSSQSSVMDSPVVTWVGGLRYPVSPVDGAGRAKPSPGGVSLTATDHVIGP